MPESSKTLEKRAGAAQNYSNGLEHSEAYIGGIAKSAACKEETIDTSLQT